MSDQRRKDERIDRRQPIWCEGQDHRRQAGETRNLSQSGMFIVSEAPAEVGSTMKVSFDDGGEAVEVNLEVMWRTESEQGENAGMGVRIVGFDKGKDAYDRLIKRHMAPRASVRPSAVPPTSTDSEGPGPA